MARGRNFFGTNLWTSGGGMHAMFSLKGGGHDDGLLWGGGDWPGGDHVGGDGVPEIIVSGRV